MSMMLRRAVMFSEEIVWRTKSSSNGIAIFNTSVETPMIVTAAFRPVQAGSGDPTPTNIRPISGWTGCNIKHSDADTSIYDTFSVDWSTGENMPGTVYGGTVTLNEDGSADLTVTHGIYTLTGSESWVKYDSNSIHGFRTNRPSGTKGSEQNVVANLVVSSTSTSRPGIRIAANTLYIYGAVELWGVADATEMKAKIKEFSDNGTPLTFTALLTTPLTYQFPNIGELDGFIGQNTIWHDMNGEITVQYQKKV